MADEKGMFLYVTPTGGKLWRLKYRFDGKEKLLSLGAYPDVSLKEARAGRDEARKLHAGKIDPSENRKVQKSCESGAGSKQFRSYCPGVVFQIPGGMVRQSFRADPND